ncbi:MAG: UDP-3-O-(3-hydroxymyristoyl)glucosamine N-acyltransferase [Bacteroidia bacterium]
MLTAEKVAQELDGELLGDSSIIINSVCKIDAGIKDAISFLANPKYEQFLETTEAGIVLVKIDQSLPKRKDVTFIKVKDPYTSFCIILGKYFNPTSHPKGISEKCHVRGNIDIVEGLYLGEFSVIGKNVKLGKNVKIYPQSYVGDNCTLGENTVIYPGVRIYSETTIGNNCIIHSGTVVGSDGFGFALQKDGTYIKIPQVGNVIIENDVEIGANCTIDRATIGSTILRQGVKLDNLIQVAHNVEIGKNTVIAAQAGISGSVKLGDNCVIGGQVGFVGHITIADGTQIGAQSGIPKNITEPGKQWIGSPIMPLKEAFRAQVIYRKLPELDGRVNNLEKK